MNLIKEPKDYIWTLPIIGGILALISVLTPAHYANEFGIEGNYWMWGIYHLSIPGYESETVFMLNEDPSQYTIPIFFSGLIPALMILIVSIMLIASSNTVRTGRTDIKNIENGWIGMGIMMIVASIIYIIAIDITWMNMVKYIYEQEFGPYPSGGPGFWDTFNPGFAVIAPFIGGGLAIVGSIASKYIKPREIPIFVGERKGPITKTPIGEISRRIKFCSECGNQLLYEGGQFCSHCGKKIKY